MANAYVLQGRLVTPQVKFNVVKGISGKILNDRRVQKTLGPCILSEIFRSFLIRFFRAVRPNFLEIRKESVALIFAPKVFKIVPQKAPKIAPPAMVAAVPGIPSVVAPAYTATKIRGVQNDCTGLLSN